MVGGHSVGVVVQVVTWSARVTCSRGTNRKAEIGDGGLLARGCVSARYPACKIARLASPNTTFHLYGLCNIAQ